MKSFRLRACFALLCLIGSVGLRAQPGWRDLPPEERRQMRQQMREHWLQESGQSAGDAGPRWRDLPPEERQRLRNEMRERSPDQPRGPRPHWHERPPQR
ncbi:hypothetical protein VX159_09030 [Dechloromonas sp. ZY10]|uniref:hypothetical protein n=1 Tax=Dechloromonas aquae TaxID=2664436 RepID=UPI0035278A2A